MTRNKLFAGFALALGLVFGTASVAAGDWTNTFQPGHTGAWYNPTTTGQGLTLNVSENGLMAVTIYTYAPADRQLGPNHLWLTGATTVEPGQRDVAVPLHYGNVGVMFDPNAEPPYIETDAGVLYLTVDTCSRVEFALKVDGMGKAYGELFQLTPPVVQCVNDCSSVMPSPLPPQCVGRTAK